MKIITLQFDNILDEEMRDYGLLLKVFKYSAYKNIPNIKFQEIIIPPPPLEADKEYFMTKNTVKLGYWIKAVEEAKEEVILMDCDMLVLKDISDAFDKDFDIGYTGERKSKAKMNGGVLFIKPTKNSLAFLHEWERINKEMYNDPKFHMKWRLKYAGMNQASFGYMSENNTIARLLSFPCSEWNACQEDWGTINENTRCLHIKSGLRRSVLSGKLEKPHFEKAYNLWHEYRNKAEEINAIRTVY